MRNYTLLLLVTLATLTVFIILPSVIGAEDLGTFRQNTCLQLIQTCGNCTFVNITSIQDPDSNTIISNVVMTKAGTYYNYTFCNTTKFGQYIYNTLGDLNSQFTVSPVSFTITSNGQEFSTSQGLIYLVLFILLIATFIFLCFSFIRINPENMRGEEGQILKINYKKYLRQFIFMMAYVCLVGIMYFAWNISYGLLYFTEMANFFYFMFRMLFIGLLVLFPVVTVIGFITLIKDKRIEIKLDRGLTVYG